ncbi:MAG: hypothetical protein Q4G34_09270 [Micrococcus sp.]|nr:hypothetical protein [Micrococcus sp.]
MDALKQMERHKDDACAYSRGILPHAVADAHAQLAAIAVAEEDWLVSDTRVRPGDLVVVTSAATRELHDQLLAAEVESWDVCRNDDGEYQARLSSGRPPKPGARRSTRRLPTSGLDAAGATNDWCLACCQLSAC